IRWIVPRAGRACARRHVSIDRFWHARGHTTCPRFNTSSLGGNHEASARKKSSFDHLLHAMVTQPVPSEKPATKARTSAQAVSVSYGDTRTREGKAASTQT